MRQPELLDAILTALGTGLGAKAAQGPAPQLVTRHSLRENGKHLQILLVEDNLVNQALAARLFEKRGHTVTVVANGKYALAALEEKAFDLIFMDVQMPEMDGYQATAAIREKERATGAHQLIIAMTAHAMVGDKERCLEAGMDDYIAKPIQTAALDEMLNRYLAPVALSPLA